MVPVIGVKFFTQRNETLKVISILSGIVTFAMKAYPLHAATALGVNSLVRGVVAAAIPSFGTASE